MAFSLSPSPSPERKCRDYTSAGRNWPPAKQAAHTSAFSLQPSPFILRQLNNLPLHAPAYQLLCKPKVGNFGQLKFMKTRNHSKANAGNKPYFRLEANIH